MLDSVQRDDAVAQLLVVLRDVHLVICVLVEALVEARYRLVGVVGIPNVLGQVLVRRQAVVVKIMEVSAVVVAWNDRRHLVLRQVVWVHVLV